MSVEVVRVAGYQWQCDNCWMCGEIEDDPAAALDAGEKHAREHDV